jgi:putative transposase
VLASLRGPKTIAQLCREHALLVPVRSEGRWHQPGHFQVTRPDELWHLDMTSVGSPSTAGVI